MSAKPTRQTGMLAWLTEADYPLFLIDHRRRVRFFNQAAEKFFACTTADVIGKICHYTSVDTGPDHVKKILHKIAPPPQVFEQKLLQYPIKFGDHPATHILFLNLEYQKTQTTILGVVLPEVHTQLDPQFAVQYNEIEIHARLEQHLEHLLTQIQEQQRDDIKQTPLIATSPQMQLAYKQWKLSLKSQLPVHIHGPQGTGKSTWLQALHYQSQLGQYPLITLPAKLLDYEHLRQHLILLAKTLDGIPAAGGVYLKLIEELPLDSQRFLLEHLEANNTLTFRWFSSSCLNRQQILERRIIIPELYYHLCPISIELPPLKNRGADFELLVQYFIEELNSHHEHQSGGVSPETMLELKKYQWPGNLAELKGVITEAHQNSRTSLMKNTDLPIRFRMGWKTQALGPRKNNSTPLNLEQLLMEQEKEWIIWALSCTSRNRAAAAQLLGMTRPRLYRRMEALGLLDESDTELND